MLKHEKLPPSKVQSAVPYEHRQEPISSSYFYALYHRPSKSCLAKFDYSFSISTLITYRGSHAWDWGFPQSVANLCKICPLVATKVVLQKILWGELDRWLFRDLTQSRPASFGRSPGKGNE
jgi:hypothetical protein